MSDADAALDAALDRWLDDFQALVDRVERVRELRARRGRDLSPAARAKADQLLLESGRLMAVLVSEYAVGEG